MQAATAHKIVVVSMVGTAGVVVVGDFAKGDTPSARSLLGLGVVFALLAGASDVAPEAAGPFAGLVFAGAALTKGAPAFDALAHAAQSKAGLGGGSSPDFSSGTSGADTQGAGSPATTTGGASGANRDAPPSARARAAVTFARSAIGTPYVFGGTTRKGFDCSGLTQWAYRLAGVSIPRTSEEQHSAGFPKIPWGAFAPGDLIFSDWGDGQASPGHVVMYAGGGQTIAAPHSGATVELEPLSTFAGAPYRGACRPAPKAGANTLAHTTG